MLTVKYRTRFIDPHLQHLPIEEPTAPTEVLVSMKSTKTEQLNKEELLERIQHIKEDNERLRRENLLFSCYLRRITTTKVIETFDDYLLDNDTLVEITDELKLPEISRRFTLKKRMSGWTKGSVNRLEHMYALSLARVEQERLSIAAYEVEQTYLEWKRMKANARVVLNHLELLHRIAESDQVAQETLKRDFERSVEKYRIDYSEKDVTSFYSKIPVDLVINRIQKRLRAHISTLALLRVSTARLRARIQEMNIDLRDADNMNNGLDEINVDLVRTKRLNSNEVFAGLDRQYKLEKSSQFPLFRRLHDSKKSLTEQETAIHDIHRKCELLQNHLERAVQEIDEIEQENQWLVKENFLLKDRMESIAKVPTITDYVHIIEQTKVLEHGIDIWTKRVTIAETLLAQLTRQTKPPRSLPPL